MKIVSRQQMSRIENRDMNLRRLSLEDLILSVAMSFEDQIIHDGPRRVLLLCGDNRNGDYGLMMAHLLCNDTDMEIKVAHSNIEEHRYHELLERDGVEVVSSQRVIKREIEKFGYIVDCISGSEDYNELVYPYDYWVRWVNESHNKYVLSCDIPSGLDPDNGTIKNECIKADKTMTIQLPKLGLYLYPGSECVGELVIEPVGLSYESLEASGASYESFNFSQIARRLPVRKSHSHKGTYGRVLLIAGSEGKSGAAILCGKALLKCGSGLLTVLSYPEVTKVINSSLFEAMTVSINETSLQYTLDTVRLDSFSLIVMGPGLGRNIETEKLLVQVLKTNVPCVIDADGLYYLSQHLDLLKRNALTVITPHQLEYERIFGFNRDTMIRDLEQQAKEYPHLITVLKGERTLISDSKGITVNTTGNNALAKGGSGDVLTGVIGGLLAQKCDRDSVIAGVYIHSLASDRWVESNSNYSLLASELIDEISKVLFEMTREGNEND